LRAAGVDLASTIRAGSQAIATGTLGARGQRAPLGKLLIAGQVALSVVLLVGAAMLARSLRNVESTDVGLDRDHLLIVDLDVRSRGYEWERLDALANTLRDKVATIPGVVGVGYSENGVFSGTESTTSLQVQGVPVRVAEDTTAN